MIFPLISFLPKQKTMIPPFIYSPNGNNDPFPHLLPPTRKGNDNPSPHLFPHPEKEMTIPPHIYPPITLKKEMMIPSLISFPHPRKKELTIPPIISYPLPPKEIMIPPLISFSLKKWKWWFLPSPDLLSEFFSLHLWIWLSFVLWDRFSRTNFCEIAYLITKIVCIYVINACVLFIYLF